MKKKIVSSFIAVAIIGVGMWAVILGATIEPKNENDLKSQQVTETNSQMATSTEASWGLSFQQDGVSPIGNSTQEYLNTFNSYYIDEKGAKDKNIYLTFDAGYENGYTEKILDVLKKEKVPAVFFLVGDYIERNPEIVRRMVEEGHTVGNHTMSHPDMAAISDVNVFRKEITDLEKLYKQTTDHDMKKFYRPPQGKYNEENLKQSKELGYNTIFWSLAYVDWYEDKQPSREEALNILNKRIHPGAIVLLHSTSKTNSEILEELIEGWKKEGYKFCDIENLSKG